MAFIFNSTQLLSILFISPSFSILLNSVERAGLVTFMYSANCVSVCVILAVEEFFSSLLNKYTIILSRIVFLDRMSSLVVVQTLQFPDMQRKFLRMSGYLLIRLNVESFVAVSKTDFSKVLNVAGKRLSFLKR